MAPIGPYATPGLEAAVFWSPISPSAIAMSALTPEKRSPKSDCPPEVTWPTASAACSAPPSLPVPGRPGFATSMPPALDPAGVVAPSATESKTSSPPRRSGRDSASLPAAAATAASSAATFVPSEKAGTGPFKPPVTSGPPPLDAVPLSAACCPGSVGPSSLPPGEPPASGARSSLSSMARSRSCEAAVSSAADFVSTGAAALPALRIAALAAGSAAPALPVPGPWWV